MRVVPASTEQVEWLISCADSPETLLMWAGPIFQYPLDAAQLHDHFADLSMEEPPARPLRAVVDGATVAYAELRDLAPKEGRGRLSRVMVDPTWRGSGLGEKFVRAVIAFAFDDLKLRRLELGVFQQNVAARRLYEKLGFKAHEIRHGAVELAGTRWDSVQMALECGAFDDDLPDR